MKERHPDRWEVPYLPIDPSDIGRDYEPIVRINSQSGKGGVAFIMEQYFGFKLPKEMHKEFADAVQDISEKQGEVTPEQIMKKFREMYINAKEPMHFRKIKIEDISEQNDTFDTKVILTYTEDGVEKVIEGYGNGPIDAVKHGLNENTKYHTKLTLYSEHALTMGSE